MVRLSAGPRADTGRTRGNGDGGHSARRFRRLRNDVTERDSAGFEVGAKFGKGLLVQLRDPVRRNSEFVSDLAIGDALQRVHRHDRRTDRVNEPKCIGKCGFYCAVVNGNGRVNSVSRHSTMQESVPLLSARRNRV